MLRVENSRIDRVKKKRRRKWLFRILTMCLILFIGIGSYFGLQVWGALAKGHDESQGKSKLRDQEVEIKKDPFAILLIGSDQLTVKEEQEAWRPDVLMVAAINPKTNSIKLVSIPRDTYTKIANTNGHKDKINSAAYWGKEKGINPVTNTRETVENLLGIPIDYYAKINFRGFMDVVNTLGGVDVNNKFYFKTTSFNSRVMRFPEGPQHLNGEQALAYVRMRKKDPEGDKGRNRRQQEVVQQLTDKIISFEGITKFSELTEAVGRNFSYNFKVTEIPALQAVYNKSKGNLETITVKTHPDKRNGIWYEILSEEEKQRIRDILQKQMEWKPKDQNQETDQTEEDDSSGEGN
ncbi:LCP family protein [Paenactinomyces guangxiensis]|uniref:LCP family protein n=1 Tax=Paenactinomyces guangxiensis TaxID=1490290 RepID=A0A7W1WSW6_9BACL|nr:LCP family protein [Paenactinomyces guangxiensis]MBA4495373.1 LCP family protein [Paenactinomyces guangxiensis]MBH8592506.1 LCP family protein [Paenactinomyces guangxiensis]